MPVAQSLIGQTISHYRIVELTDEIIRLSENVAIEERLARINGDRDSIPRIPPVVQVIAVSGIIDVHIIVIVPVV
jgi:hypothetical protein